MPVIVERPQANLDQKLQEVTGQPAIFAGHWPSRPLLNKKTEVSNPPVRSFLSAQGKEGTAIHFHNVSISKTYVCIKIVASCFDMFSIWTTYDNRTQ